MADFTVSYVGGPEGSPVTPLAPVEDRSSLVGLSALSNIAEGVSGFASDFAEQRRIEAKERAQAELEAYNSSVMSEFGQKQLRIAEALETGEITSSAQARSLMRHNLTRAIADNPSLTVDLGKVHTNLLKSTGLGEAVYEGTDEEKQFRAIESKALERGWVTPNMAQGDKLIALEAMRSFDMAQEQMKFAQQKNSLAESNISLRTAGITQRKALLQLDELSQRKQSQVAVGQMAQAYQVKLSNDLEAIRQKKESGEISPEQAVMLADQAYLNVETLTRQVGAQAGNDYITNMTTGLRMQYDNYKGYLSGKTKLETLNTMNATAIAIQTNLALGDPLMGRLAAVSKIVPNSEAVTVGTGLELASEFLRNGANPNTWPNNLLANDEESKQKTENYLKFIDNSLSAVNRGTAIEPELTKQELNNNINDMLKGISVYGPGASSPSDYNQVVDMLANVEFGKFIKSQDGFTDNDARQRASDIFDSEYYNKVMPVVLQEYKRTQILTKTGTRTRRPTYEPTASRVVPKFTGSGVSFMPEQGLGDSNTISQAKELNEKVAPVLNRMIRAAAHLNATTDYRSVYENQFANLFLQEEQVEENVDGGNTGE